LTQHLYQYRPWFDEDDAKNVLFCSTHLFKPPSIMDQSSFFPGTGSHRGRLSLFLIKDILENTDHDSDVYPGGVLNVPLIPGLQGTSVQLREAFTSTVLPRLVAFEPDFILISAGFDAHERDHLHRPRETMITEFDYQWITAELVKVANRFCEGRLISVLEGGYNTNLGPLSPLAMSVAAHVRALLNTNSAFINPSYQLDSQALLGKRAGNEDDLEVEVNE
jgi:acetoin utilization deacetylase AcuC-like enzyme